MSTGKFKVAPPRSVDLIAAAALSAAQKGKPVPKHWNMVMRSLDARLDRAERQIDDVLERQARKRA